MKKILLILFVIISLPFAIAAFGLKYYNFDKYKDTIAKKVEEITGNKLSINGHIEVKLLPSPKIILGDIVLANSQGFKSPHAIKAAKATIDLNITQLFQGKIEQQSLTFDDAEINLEATNTQNKNLSFFVTNSSSINLNNIVFANSTINIVYQNGTIKQLPKAKLVVEQKNNKVEISSAFFKSDNNSTPLNLKASIETSASPYKTIIEINDPSFQLKAEGAVTENASEKVLQFHGHFDADILDFALISDPIYKTFPNLPTLDSTKLKQNIDIEGIVDISEAGFKTYNTVISSGESLKGTAECSFVLNENPYLNISVNSEKNNLDEILQLASVPTQPKDAKPETSDSKDDKAKVYEPGNLAPIAKNSPAQASTSSFIHLETSNSIDINLDLQFTNITLDKKTFKQAIVQSGIKSGALYVSKFLINNDQELKIEITDTKTVVVEGLNVLVGDLAIEGPNVGDGLAILGYDQSIKLADSNKKFSFNSKLVLSSDEFTLYSINSIIDLAQISGRWTRKGDITDIDIKISNFNLAAIDFPEIREFLNKILFTSNEVGYIASYSTLRDFKGNAKIVINGTQLKYHDQNINSISLHMDTVAGKFKISDTVIDADFAKLTSFDMNVDSGILKPKVDINSVGTYINLKTVADLLDLPLKDNPITQFEISDKPIHLFRFDKYDGTFKFDIASTFFDKQDLGKLLFTGSLQDSAFLVDKLSIGLWSGTAEFTGNYKMVNDVPAFSLTFSLDQIESSKLFAGLSKDKKIQGVLSASGNIYSQGKTTKEIIQTVNCNSNFTGRNLDYFGLNLAKVVSVTSKQEFIESFKVANVVEDSFKEGTTHIDAIDGKIVSLNGNVQIQDTTFTSYYSNGAIGAGIDLKNNLINGMVTWSFTPNNHSDVIQTYFNMSGNLDNPSVTIDKAQLVKYIADNFDSKSPEELAKEHADQIKAEETKKRNAKFLYEKIQ